MSWLRLTIETNAGQVESLAGLLEQFSVNSLSFQPAASDQLFADACGDNTVWWSRTAVSALLDPDIDMDVLLACIRNRIGTENIHRHRIEPLPKDIWIESHKREFNAIRFAGRLIVKPSWDESEYADLPTIILEPGLAFGSGKHATTALCLEWLAANDLHGKTLIDYGCGSGILALAAARLGASRVHAVDIDPQAVSATRQNAEKNNLLDRIQIACPPVTPPPADILMGNILLNPLMSLAPVFAKLVHPDGVIVLSGILANQVGDCQAHFEKWFTMGPPVYRDEWALLTGCRSTP
jgi:ribosomal protein L11 methyltransferase